MALLGAATVATSSLVSEAARVKGRRGTAPLTLMPGPSAQPPDERHRPVSDQEPRLLNKPNGLRTSRAATIAMVIATPVQNTFHRNRCLPSSVGVKANLLARAMGV
jgi:hypothetical protein